MMMVRNEKDILNIFFEHELALEEEAEERRQEDYDVDFEALDKIADAMTDMVYQDINEKFQNSFMGQFIKPHYFKSTPISKSVFEEVCYVYGFCLVTYLKMGDIDFSVPNNPFTAVAEEFSEFTDLEQFMFILECQTINTDLSRLEKYEIRIDIRPNKSDSDVPFFDLQNITQLNNVIAKNQYPYYCNTTKKKVIYSIFELDATRINNDIDMEYVINNYDKAQKLINDYDLINQMESI